MSIPTGNGSQRVVFTTQPTVEQPLGSQVTPHYSSRLYQTQMQLNAAIWQRDQLIKGNAVLWNVWLAAQKLLSQARKEVLDKEKALLATQQQLHTAQVELRNMAETLEGLRVSVEESERSLQFLTVTHNHHEEQKKRTGVPRTSTST